MEAAAASRKSIKLEAGGKGVPGMANFDQRIGQHKTKVITNNGVTEVVYHDTAVVTFNDDHIILDSGGWWTRTTKARMNQAAQQFGLGYSVKQVQGAWVVTFQDQDQHFEANRIRLDRKIGYVSVPN